MKIATWNLEFLKRTSSKANTDKIVGILKEVNADIWILTETNSVISPGDGYKSVSSNELPDPKPYAYKIGDYEVTIWSKHQMTKIPIRESSTSVCAKVKVSEAELTIYGTVIGVLGVRKGFLNDVERQIADWKLLTASSGDICIAGDFNVCWSGNHYSKVGSKEISNCLDQIGMHNLTSGIDGNVDHIAISKSFIKTGDCMWNLDKKLSDHIGVSVTLE